MSDGNGKSSGTIGMKLFLFLAFVAIFFLGYNSYRDGARSLSISDVYYRKYFKSSDGK